MPRTARLKSRSGIYHIMLRGANRQEFFHDDEDRLMFLKSMARYKKQSDFKVYAWCLMNNHVHLLLKEGNEDISLTMKRVGVSFVSYYNWKYRTTGHLFQDRFKSECVESRGYFLRVVRYIHQNPVKAGMVQRADEWKWSSCLGYYGQGFQKQLLDSELLYEQFSDNLAVARERFREFNESLNDDNCLDEPKAKKRLTDEEARIEIQQVLGAISITQVKALPISQRNTLLRSVKRIKGVTLRQAARILGVSVTLIHRA